METLVLHRNQLTALPADMNHLRQLKYLDASYNQVRYCDMITSPQLHLCNAAIHTLLPHIDTLFHL